MKIFQKSNFSFPWKYNFPQSLTLDSSQNRIRNFSMNMIYAFLCASVHNFECWLFEHVATHKSFSFLFGGQLGSFVLLFFLVLECFTILQSHGGQKWTSFNILGIFFCNGWRLFDLLILVRISWHAHLMISNDVFFPEK